MLLVILPPLIYFGRCRDELARVQTQPAADRAARRRLRGVHHLRRGGGGALPAGLRLGGRLRARRDRRAARRGGAARHRAAARPAAPAGSVILEGEGLANDATALILYRFAVAAVSTGASSRSVQAAGTFGLIVVGEIVYGVAVGWLSLRLRNGRASRGSKSPCR